MLRALPKRLRSDFARTACATLLLGLTAASARTLEVGPGKAYPKPSLAANAAKDGDTVLFTSTVFAADAATWSQSNLTLRAAAACAHMKAQGAQAAGKGTWVVQGNNVTVENIEFSEAAVPDQNGAGIRMEGGDLTIRHCYFHDNENGILGGEGNAQLLIEYSEFARNGYGDGYTHNMYIGKVKSFTLRYCYSHHAKIGHNIKSRAEKNYILCNRSLDGVDGTASYELDLPNGGLAVITGNVFQQGPATDNPTMLAYGEEGLSNPGNAVYIVNNTFVNDRTQGGTFISIAGSTPIAKVQNNLFTGSGSMLSGKADTSANLVTQNPGFIDKANYDYRLTAASPAIDKGKDPGLLDLISLLPAQQFVPPNTVTARLLRGAIDIGAYEYAPGAALGPAHGRIAYPEAMLYGFARAGFLFYPDGPRDGLGRAAR